jgi:hypothetical protein
VVDAQARGDLLLHLLQPGDSGFHLARRAVPRAEDAPVPGIVS